MSLVSQTPFLARNGHLSCNANKQELTPSRGIVIKSLAYLRTKAAPLNTSWLTRPLFTFPPRLVRILMIAMIVLSVGSVMSPAIITLAWHLRHGNTIAWRGSTVVVPPGVDRRVRWRK
jgi:hypothetical protein